MAGPVAPERVPGAGGDLLEMQALVGNRAVARMISSGAPPLPPRPGARGRVQRHVTGGPHSHDDSASIAQAQQLIADAPIVQEEDVPDGDKVAPAVQAGQGLGEEVGGVQGKPAAAAIVHEELNQGEADGEAPSAESVGALSDYASGLQGGPAAPAADEAGADGDGESEAGESEGDGDGAGPGPVGERPKNRRTRHGNRTKAVATISSAVTSVGSSVAKVGMQIAGAASTGAQTAGTVLGYVAAGLGAIAGMLDVRAAISSGRKARALETVMADLKAKNPGDARLIDAIQYAINQKYSKTKIRALKAITGLTSAGITIAALVVGVGLAALATNPVGWAIAAVIVGLCAVTGVSIMLYKLGRKLWKWFKGDLGVQRRKMALALYDRAIAGDALAVQALKELGLDPEKMRSRAAAGEGDAAKAKREAGSGFKAVAATKSRHEGKVAQSRAAVEASQAKIARLKEKIVAYEAAMARASGAAVANYVALIARLEAEVKAEEEQLKKHEEKLASREHKLGNDEVAADWKAHSKKAREDIAFIERKLKK